MVEVLWTTVPRFLFRGNQLASFPHRPMSVPIEVRKEVLAWHRPEHIALRQAIQVGGKLGVRSESTVPLKLHNDERRPICIAATHGLSQPSLKPPCRSGPFFLINKLSNQITSKRGGEVVSRVSLLSNGEALVARFAVRLV